MHYFVIESTPAPNNEQEQGVGGAYVSCWINFTLADGAELLARYYIEKDGWIPGEVHERKWVEKDDYQDNPEHLQYYLEAEADGASFVFHSWDADAEDADVDHPEH
jgi:hypothetical protein